jgi:hypothetical protein
MSETSAAAGTAGIRIEREAAPWRDRARKYKVVVDAAEIGTVADGETQEFRLEPGEHSLRLKLDWAGSATVALTLAVGEVATFRCRPGGRSWSALWQSIFARNRYIVLEPGPSD